MDLQEKREDILNDIEALRHTEGDVEKESLLSINQWIDRIKAASNIAHEATRSGNLPEQRAAFRDIAAIAVARLECLPEE